MKTDPIAINIYTKNGECSKNSFAYSHSPFFSVLHECDVVIIPSRYLKKDLLRQDCGSRNKT